MPSVSPTNVPLKSTFDAKGVEQAKAGIRDVEQAAQKADKPGVLKRGDRREGDRLFRETRTDLERYEQQVKRLGELQHKGAISADTYQRALKQAQDKYLPDTGPGAKLRQASELARQTGIPGLEGLANMGSKLATPMTGLATASVAAFVGLQRAAIQAREIRLESTKLGTSVGFYRDLAWYARDAGISMEEAAGGVQQISGAAGAARGGDLGQAAYFASLGIRGKDLWAMAGNNGQLAQLAATRGTAAQQIQGFGSVAAAQVAAQSQPDNAEARARNDALEASNLKLQDMPSKLMAGVNNVLGASAAGWQMIFRSVATGQSLSQSKQDMLDEAARKEENEAAARAKAAAVQAGTQHGQGLLNVHERSAAQADVEQGYDYSQLTDLTGVSEETFRKRSALARLKQRRQFNAQFQSAEERALSEHDTTNREEETGEITRNQATRKRIAIDRQKQQFDAQFQTARERAYAEHGLTTREENAGALSEGQAYRKRIAIEEQQAAELSGVRSGGENLREQMRIAKRKWLDPNLGEEAPERRDQARQMGDSLAQFAESMTASGPQAGAYGINTVQGASALMGAEYQMDQSQQTLRMVELLTQIAVNTGKMTPDQAAAVRDQQGFRHRDPINDLFGDG